MAEKLKLHIFQRAGIESDVSPFGVKLELFLRAAKIDYEIVEYAEHQMKNSPKQKCPYVKRSDLNDGKELADSAIIIKALVEKGIAPDFDAWLSDSDKLVSTAMRSMFEDCMYFYAYYVKWATDLYWTDTYPLYFGGVPFFIRPVIGYMVRRDALAACHGQGTGRHSEEEVLQFATEKVKTVSDFLGNKKYFMGDKLSTLDFTAFGLLSNYASGTWKHPVLDLVRNDKRLMDYVQRMREEFFPDLIAAAEEAKKKDGEKKEE